MADDTIRLTPQQALDHFGRTQAGPCAGCGATGYGLSMGGPAICPACDCMPPASRVRELADENRRLRALLMSLPGGPDALRAGDEEQRAQWLAQLEVNAAKPPRIA